MVRSTLQFCRLGLLKSDPHASEPKSGSNRLAVGQKVYNFSANIFTAKMLSSFFKITQRCDFQRPKPYDNDVESLILWNYKMKACIWLVDGISCLFCFRSVLHLCGFCAQTQTESYINHRTNVYVLYCVTSGPNVCVPTGVALLPVGNIRIRTGVGLCKVLGGGCDKSFHGDRKYFPSFVRRVWFLG